MEKDGGFLHLLMLYISTRTAVSWWDHISHSVIFKQLANIQQSPHLSSTLDRHRTIIPEWIKENSEKEKKYADHLYLCCIPLACDKYTKWKRSQTVSTIDYEKKKKTLS